MSGYEKSEDYGAPGPVNWRRVLVVLAILAGLMAMAILRWR
jgi:hypothetical protein